MAASASRRRVKLPTTGAIGIPSIGARVAASVDADLASGRSVEFDVGVHVSVLRPTDLVVLDVHATGMHLEPGPPSRPPTLETDGDGARLVVTFPFQHLGEETFEIVDDPAPPIDVSVISRHSAAQRSRVVFAVPPGTSIEFSSSGILSAMRTLPLVVVPAAQPRAAIRPRWPQIEGPIILPGGLVFGSAEGQLVVVPGSRTAILHTGLAAVMAGSTALRATRRRIGTGTARIASSTITDLEARWTSPWDTIRPRGPQVRTPRDDETAIEVPWRLVLSPSDREGFTHADEPVVADDDGGHVELWHSRLGVRVMGPDGTTLRQIDESQNPQRIVRAIWTRDRDLMADPPPISDEETNPLPFRMPMSVNDRWAIVRQSAETLSSRLGTTVRPLPVDVERLMMSSLGTWLTSHGVWDPRPYTSLGHLNTVESWDHIAPMGRDQFVKITYPGYLCSPGNCTSFVKETERLIESATNPVARLRTRYYFVVTQRTVTFANNDFPFTSITISPGRTPSLKPPQLSNPPGSRESFIWPTMLTGEPFLFLIEATDRDGHVWPFHAPLMWVNAALVDGPKPGDPSIDATYRDPALDRHRIPTHGKRFAYAPSTTPGDTSFETATLHLRGELANNRITPHLVAADVTTPAAKALTPQAAGFTMRYRQDYVEDGFAPDPTPTDAQIFGEVVDLAKADDLEADASPNVYPGIGFGSTERSGGFIKPDQEIALLSRAKGTTGKLAAAAGTPGKFDPAEFLGDALPRLFGLFDLADVLGALGIDEMPAFVTETLGAVHSLLADVRALTDTIERAVADAQQVIDDAQAAGATAAAWATDTIAQLEAVGAQLLGDVDALEAALLAMLDPTAPKDADAVRALFDPVQSAYGTIRGAVDTIALPPALSTPLRRLVDGLAPYLETLDALEDTVLSVISFLEGLDPENLEIRAKLDWSPPMVPWPDATHPVFSVRQAEGGGLTISVEARVSAKSEPRVDVLAELRRFDLDLIAPDSLMALHFERLAFTAGSSRKPEVDVVFGGIEFLGPLSFIETLKELIPFDGFSDPPFLDVSPAGVRAGFTLELPNIAVGVFALQNISLGADCSIPFLGKHLSIGFNFCTRERPFALTVTFIGGGGFVGLRLSPEGLDLLEMSLEAGARLAIDLGIASGSIEMMVGVYLRLEGDGGSLTGYIRIRGEVDVLGLISASIELLLEMIYDFGTGKLVGRATLTIEVEVFMFSFSVSTTVERQLAGSNGDPAFVELMDVAPDATSTRWSEYCTSFAAGAV